MNLLTFHVQHLSGCSPIRVLARIILPRDLFHSSLSSPSSTRVRFFRGDLSDERWTRNASWASSPECCKLKRDEVVARVQRAFCAVIFCDSIFSMAQQNHRIFTKQLIKTILENTDIRDTVGSEKVTRLGLFFKSRNIDKIFSSTLMSWTWVMLAKKFTFFV